MTETRKPPETSVTTVAVAPSVTWFPWYSPNAPSPALARWQKPGFILFLILFAVNEALLLLRIHPTGQARWVEGLFLVSATLCALVSLAQRLPLQNVLTAGLLIFSISGFIVGFATATHVPFGPLVYSDAMGMRIFDAVPWTVPMLWIVIIITGRGVARLMMRPWRKTNYYGFWVMGITAALAVLFDLGLEPFAVSVKHYWMWRPTLTSLQWHMAPWVNFLGWFVTAFVIVIFTLPWLVNKQPVKRPMDYLPLMQWMLLQTWLFTGNALHGFLAPCIVAALGVIIILVLAIRGARW